MKKMKLVKNIISGFVGQSLAIALGLIVPRLFISSYGSDVNGLLNTIVQIFTYLALLEAGIGQAAKNLLYKPIAENNPAEVSRILSIAKAYYSKFTIVYGSGVLILAFIMPFMVKTSVDSLTIALMVLFEGMSGVISFYFVQIPSIVIGVDGKSYINNSFNLINKIVGYAVKIMMAAMNLNIVLLQFVFFLVTIAKVFFYEHYFRKHYSWINLKKVERGAKLKDRNSYIVIEICWTIFSSTDMIILSMFLNTKMASVYGIYNMVFANITLLLNAVYISVNYLLGQSYHEGREKYINMHDSFNSIFFGLITGVMVVCYYLTIPFISLYTQGVTDVNYIYSTLPLLFCLVQLLSWSRYIAGNLVTVAGRTRKAVWVNILEAALNLVFSVALVQKYGVSGVLFATVIALPAKSIYCNYVGDKVILKRSCLNTIKILGTNFFMFFVAVIIYPFFHIVIDSYLSFFIHGVVYSIVIVGVVIMINVLINPSMIAMMKNMRKRREL